MDGDAREVTEGEVAALIGRLALGTPELDDAGRIELIGVLEALKGATAAAQARVSVDFAASQEAQAAAAGVPKDKRGTGIGAQVALARRESPVRGSRHLGLAKALVGEMPATYAALQTGRITEWTATLMVRATACLSVEDRGAVDTRMGHRLGRLSDRATAAAAEALAYELDPEAFVARARKAVADRQVTVRPAPDTMAYLTALLPVAEAVACYAALDKTAKATKSGGDERGLGQLRADTLVARLTGVDPAVGFPVEIQLVMSDATLFAHGAGSGHLPGFGPLPADLARDLAATGTTRRDHTDATDTRHDHTDTSATGPHEADRSERADRGDGTDRADRGDAEAGAEMAGTGAGSGPTPRQRAWVRRLFLDSADGSVWLRDTRRRRFDGPLRDLLIARDQRCRTPWCDAPIRHLDHITPHRDGGPTIAGNGEGLCEACNYTNEAPRWATERIKVPGGPDQVKITTPTGHTYYSQAPPALESITDLHQQKYRDPAPAAGGDPPDPYPDTG